MTAIDLSNLIRFNTGMSMFINSQTRADAISFLQGYEYGRGNECQFTEALGEHLARRHLIKASSLGWSHQVERLAEKPSLDWIEVYLLVSSEVLSHVLEAVKTKT